MRAQSEIVDLCRLHGCNNLSDLLTSLLSIQERLSDLSKAWLSLPLNLFGELGVTRQSIWLWLVSESRIQALVEANTRSGFKSAFLGLLFDSSMVSASPTERTAYSRIANELSQKVPYLSASQRIIAPASRSAARVDESEPRENITPSADLARTEKQIDAIVDELRQGKERNVELFLRELEEGQLAISGGKDRVVKTLCNLAQRAREVHRPDFSLRMLDRALEISPSDGLAMFQKGTLLKTKCEFQAAEKLLNDALSFGVGNFDRSLIANDLADLKSRMGDFSGAIQSYMTQAGWFDNVHVIVSIADNQRRLGDLEAARANL